MSHLSTGTKFSDLATFVFSVPWLRGSARSYHISFHSVRYYAYVLSTEVFLSSDCILCWLNFELAKIS